MYVDWSCQKMVQPWYDQTTFCWLRHTAKYMNTVVLSLVIAFGGIWTQSLVLWPLIWILPTLWLYVMLVATIGCYITITAPSCSAMEASLSDARAPSSSPRRSPCLVAGTSHKTAARERTTYELLGQGPKSRTTLSQKPLIEALSKASSKKSHETKKSSKLLSEDDIP